MASAAQAYQATLISQDSSGTKNARPKQQPDRERAAQAPPPQRDHQQRRADGRQRPDPGRRERGRQRQPAGQRREHRRQGTQPGGSALASALSADAGSGRGPAEASALPGRPAASAAEPPALPVAPVLRHRVSCLARAALCRCSSVARNLRGALSVPPAAVMRCDRSRHRSMSLRECGDRGAVLDDGRCRQEGGRVSRRGWVLFAAMSVIWGMPYLLIKVAVGGVAVPVLVLARVGDRRGAAAADRDPAAASSRAAGRHWRWLAAVRASSRSSLPWLLLSEAERRLSSSTDRAADRVGADHRGWCSAG